MCTGSVGLLSQYERSTYDFVGTGSYVVCTPRTYYSTTTGSLYPAYLLLYY